MAGWVYVIHYYIDARTRDLKDGTRFVIVLLDWDKPSESVTPKTLGCTFAGTHGDTSLFHHHCMLAFVPGIHEVKCPSSFMVELRRVISRPRQYLQICLRSHEVLPQWYPIQLEPKLIGTKIITSTLRLIKVSNSSASARESCGLYQRQ